MRSLILASAISLAASAAVAQNGPIIAYPQQNDTVALSLSVEDWVQTSTARTELAVDASLPGSDAGKVRGDILNSIKGLVQGAEWRFTRFDRDQDSSGLEHWHAVLEARLPEAQLGGLSDRAKQASKPGIQIKIQTTDFSPALAEIEAAKAKLRGDMYKKVNEALAQLNQSEPDRKYRLMNINFLYIAPNFAAPAQRRAAGLEEATVTADGNAGVIQRSQKLQMSASVTFAARAPNE